MVRRTKIVATLGPASDDPKMLDKIIEAGVDLVRINFSHGSPEEHIDRVEKLRNRARAHGRQVGVLADLQGPKIRIERFKDGPVELAEGDIFVLDGDCGSDDGNKWTYSAVWMYPFCRRMAWCLLGGRRLDSCKRINKIKT